MSKRPSHSPWSRPLADLVDAVIDPVLARQGFGESQIVLYWEDIVGERLAAMSEPLALKWPPRGPARTEHAPATLVVRVETGFALELQHLAAIVIERVNGYLGFACIDRLALRQGPVTRRAQARASGRPPRPSCRYGRSDGPGRQRRSVARGPGAAWRPGYRTFT